MISAAIYKNSVAKKEEKENRINLKTIHSFILFESEQLNGFDALHMLAHSNIILG